MAEFFDPSAPSSPALSRLQRACDALAARWECVAEWRQGESGIFAAYTRQPRSPHGLGPGHGAGATPTEALAALAESLLVLLDARRGGDERVARWATRVLYEDGP